MSTVRKSESFIYGDYVTLETIICYCCGVPFAVPDTLKRHFRNTQESFYCPNGHQQAYTKSTETILKEKIERIEREKRQREADLQNEVESWKGHWQAKVTENKGLRIKAGKLKKRIAHGVCPCCNRTFQNLAEHIKKEHPEELTSTKDITV